MMKKAKKLETVWKTGEDVKIAQEWGKKMYEYSKSIVAVRTGNLRDKGIKLENTDTGFRFYVDEQIAPYGKYLETGTKRMRRQSFYFPSIDKHTPGMITALKEYYLKV